MAAMQWMALSQYDGYEMTGVVGAVCGSPLFLVKARIQAASSAASINAQYVYSGMVRALTAIAMAKRLIDMIAGWVPRYYTIRRLSWAVPRCLGRDSSMCGTFHSNSIAVSFLLPMFMQ